MSGGETPAAEGGTLLPTVLPTLLSTLLSAPCSLLPDLDGNKLGTSFASLDDVGNPAKSSEVTQDLRDCSQIMSAIFGGFWTPPLCQ